jgi:hypothetical protein
MAQTTDLAFYNMQNMNYISCLISFSPILHTGYNWKKKMKKKGYLVQGNGFAS